MDQDPGAVCGLDAVGMACLRGCLYRAVAGFDNAAIGGNDANAVAQCLRRKGLVSFTSAMPHILPETGARSSGSDEVEAAPSASTSSEGISSKPVTQTRMKETTKAMTQEMMAFTRFIG